MKLEQLCNKCQIRISNLSSFFHKIKSLIVTNFPAINKISQNYSSTTRDTLHTVNIYLSITLLSFFNEFDCIVKDTFNIFPHMILKMISFIGNWSFKIICTVVGGAVYYMSKAMLGKNFFISSNAITPQK